MFIYAFALVSALQEIKFGSFFITEIFIKKSNNSSLIIKKDTHSAHLKCKTKLDAFDQVSDGSSDISWA